MQVSLTATQNRSRNARDHSCSVYVTKAQADNVLDFTRHQRCAEAFPEGKRIMHCEVLMTDTVKRCALTRLQTLIQHTYRNAIP